MTDVRLLPLYVMAAIFGWYLEDIVGIFHRNRGARTGGTGMTDVRLLPLYVMAAIFGWYLEDIVGIFQ